MSALCAVSKIIIPILLLAAGNASVRAEVTPHPLFCEGMVLQRDAEVPVWGWAKAGEQVTVEFAGQKKTSGAATDGKWLVRLGPMSASAEPRTLIIKSATGNRQAAIANVVVGEVWLCSGQSNMQVGVGDGKNAQQEQREANYPLIRVATVGVFNTPIPQSKPTLHRNRWEEATPENVLRLTAVGYFFGRELHKQLNVPVGLVCAAMGGTPAESWMSTKVLRADPELAWTADLSFADHQKAGGNFNGMIHPLVPYRFRGAIWYQGEDNLFRGWTYRKTLPALIAEWRDLWGAGKPEEIPFGIVQLAGQGTAFDFPFLNSVWAETRESQAIVAKEPGNGLAVTLDLSVDDYDIHPKNKQEIGRRLSLWALNKIYGQTDVEYQGPVFASQKIEAGRIRLSFSPTGGGLVSKGGPPSFFSIAGADQQFKWATAAIDGDTIVVSSPEVADPVAVRYAWSHGPCTASKSQIVNVYGKNGLPLGCFRTDNWKPESAPDVTFPTTVLPAGTIGQPYSRSLATAAARGSSITYDLAPDTRMPAGLKLDTNGQVTGIPTAPKTFVFKARATASSAATRDADVILTVRPKGGPPQWTIGYDANGATGGAVPACQTKSGDAAVTVAANTGGLKRNGHTFDGWNTAPDGSGEAYGEGAAYGTNADTVLYAKWGAIKVDYADLTLPAATAGQKYKATAATAKAGDAHLTYEKMSGKLPAGLNFDFPFGTLSGTPAEVGTFSIMVKAKTNTGPFKEAKVTVTVKAADGK